ncbi:17428_t:CDS:2 [Rhizophagus irregularis]|nr:17428_t:CDS:2 [Rhizophagus irregularis]
MDRKDAILYYFDIEKDNNLAFHTPKLPLPIVSEENTGRVDNAIQALEELMRETHIKLLLGSLRLKNRADTSAENAGLKARVAKLEQESRQSQNDFSPKELVNITESVAVYSPVCETNDVVSEVRLSIDNPVPASSKSSENRKTDAFMDEVNKKNTGLQDAEPLSPSSSLENKYISSHKNHENKVADICSKTGVVEKTAKTQVYTMIKTFYPRFQNQICIRRPKELEVFISYLEKLLILQPKRKLWKSY